MLGETIIKTDEELEISFGYQCSGKKGTSYEVSNGIEIPLGAKLRRNSHSFSCLSGAAISANATLANTNICNGLIGTEILPSLDSPKSFRKAPSSSSLSRLDILSSSLQSSMSILSCSMSTQSDPSECDLHILKSTSAPSGSEGFLNSMEVQMAGGAAGEDRVQAVCSEENGWLFCAIYDGFNGRDAADFLAGTLYDTIGFYFNLLDSEQKLENYKTSDVSLQYFVEDKNNITTEDKVPSRIFLSNNQRPGGVRGDDLHARKEEVLYNSSRHRVLDSLQCALGQAESDFLCMVEQEMEDRPDLVSVGSCVLVVVLHGKDLYTLNLGDSRAVMATYSEGIDMDESETLKPIQLSDIHTVDNEIERTRLLDDHPDDPTTIVSGKVKGKLKVTRAFGVGYLKKKTMNDALIGILKVRNLLSPPYISTQPSLNVHKISKNDHFVIVGSDGLFDFFSNDEAVKLVHFYILNNPSGDPAKFLVEQLVLRAADRAGFSMEELMNIPAGRRRKYHDDVTVIVILLGANQRTSKASTFL